VGGAAALTLKAFPNSSPDAIQQLLEDNTFLNHPKTNDDGTGLLEVLFLPTPPVTVSDSPTISDSVTMSTDIAITDTPTVSDTVTVGISPAADLDVTKVVNLSTVPGGIILDGSTFNYTITVTNNGPDTAANVTVFDILPA